MLNVRPFQLKECVNEIERILNQSKKQFGSATFAIPGGRSPHSILTALSEQISEELRKDLHLLWVDERAVPLRHKDRNDIPTLEAWKRGGALPNNIHPMPAEQDDLNLACQNYQETISKITEQRNKIDVCLLGIGEDGHFASLFPNHSMLQQKNDVFYLSDSPKPPPMRMSLSLPLISKSNLNIVLAFGEEKGQILKKASNPNPEIPVSLLPRDNMICFLDAEAMAVFSD